MAGPSGGNATAGFRGALLDGALLDGTARCTAASTGTGLLGNAAGFSGGRLIAAAVGRFTAAGSGNATGFTGIAGGGAGFAMTAALGSTTGGLSGTGGISR